MSRNFGSRFCLLAARRTSKPAVSSETLPCGEGEASTRTREELLRGRSWSPIEASVASICCILVSRLLTCFMIRAKSIGDATGDDDEASCPISAKRSLRSGRADLRYISTLPTDF